MQILVLLGMYFDVVVVFVTSQTLLFRSALAILWYVRCDFVDSTVVKNFHFVYVLQSVISSELCKEIYLNIRVYENGKMEIFVMNYSPEELQTWHLFILG